MKGKPISRGHNSAKTHAGLLRKYGHVTHHAETSCLMGVQKADTILVVRVRRKDGQLSCSKPCDKCQKFLRDKGIKKVYYSTWEGSIDLIKL